jgi:hypothetical protein
VKCWICRLLFSSGEWSSWLNTRTHLVYQITFDLQYSFKCHFLFGRKSQVQQMSIEKVCRKVESL